MAKKAYIATIQLLIVDVDRQTEACDAISEMLTDYTVGYKEGNVLLDWSYLRVGAQLLLPVERSINDDYQEGDFVS